MTRNIILLIVFAALIVLVVINAGPIWTGLRTFGSYFNSLLLGIVIAFILNRPCMFIDDHLGLKKTHPALSRNLAIIFTYLMVMLIIFTLIMFVVPQIIDSIQQFVHRLSSYTANSQEWLDRITGILQLQSVDLASLSHQLLTSIQRFTENISLVFTSIVGITAGVINFIFTFFIALIFSIYLLAGKETILENSKTVFRVYLSPRVYSRLAYVYHITVDVFNKFVYGQLSEAVILGFLCFAGMLMLRFEYPVMISTLVGVTALVPMIGAYIGGAIAVFVLVLVSPVQALWFVVFLVILQQFEGNVIYPRVVGGSLGLPGIWVLLATIIGSGLAGPVGILLGVPIATILYTLLKNDVRQKESMERE